MTDFYLPAFSCANSTRVPQEFKSQSSINGIKKVALSLEAGGKLDVMGFSGYNGHQSVLERWVQVRADMNKRR